MVTALFDLAHGGRWTSLRAAGREWLWHRPDPLRDAVRPGDPFVDAGGVEECVPTIRGVPDHGAAWSRPWTSAGVDCGEFRLSRTVVSDGDALAVSDGDALAVSDGDALAASDGGALETVRSRRPDSRRLWTTTEIVRPRCLNGPHPEGGGGQRAPAHHDDEGCLVVSYRLEAAPGFRFVWAAHALLDLSAGATLEAPAGTETRIDGGAVEAWPTPLAALGPDDGTAVGAILVDCPTVTVADGERLTFTLDAPGQPVSTALWRNLRGWPLPAPYRSIGVEPLLGRVFDLAEAGPGDAAVVPPTGACEWRLRISAVPADHLHRGHVHREHR